jgi:CrcB protein
LVAGETSDRHRCCQSHRLLGDRLAGLIASNRLVVGLYWREFVFVGVLGGFTTFSTFGLDTFTLTQTHSGTYAILNLALQVIGGLLAVWAGYAIGLARA